MSKDVLGEEYLLDAKEDTKIKSNIPDFDGLTPYQAQKKLQKYFREVFSSEHGKIVLGAILEDLYYFDGTNSERTAALSDYAKRLLSDRLGINNNYEIINALLSIE